MNNMLLDLFFGVQGTFNRKTLIKMLEAYRDLMVLHTNPRNIIDFKKGIYPKEIKLQLGGRKKNTETGFEKVHAIVSNLLVILNNTNGRQVNIKLNDGYLLINFVQTKTLHRYSMKQANLSSRESALLLGDK